MRYYRGSRRIHCCLPHRIFRGGTWVKVSEIRKALPAGAAKASAADPLKCEKNSGPHVIFTGTFFRGHKKSKPVPDCSFIQGMQKGKNSMELMEE
jgi:hypothetical protein